VAEEEDRGGKSTVPEYRKGPEGFKEETSTGRGIRGPEKSALLRKTLSEKKEETGGSSEAKEEAPQTCTAIRVGAKTGTTVTRGIEQPGPNMRE
jgi:hypothetical protein